MGLIYSRTKHVVILSGASLSNAFSLGEKVLDAIQMPAAWTTAALTFQVSDDNGTTWTELLANDGTAVTLASPAAGKRYNMYGSDFQSSGTLKVRSGTSASPVTQGGDRNIVFISRKAFPSE